jgi:hypothetical protein
MREGKNTGIMITLKKTYPRKPPWGGNLTGVGFL